MSEYRAYILNVGGKIVEAVDFVRSDDEAAKKHVQDMAGSHDVELWQGKRQVTVLRKPRW